MGVDASRVKMALQRRVLQSRPMYANVNELLDAAFREQREQVGLEKLQGLPDHMTPWGLAKVSYKLNVKLTDKFRYKNIPLIKLDQSSPGKVCPYKELALTYESSLS